MLCALFFVVNLISGIPIVDIKQVQFNPLYPMHGTPVSAASRQADPVISDGFSRSAEPAFTPANPRALFMDVQNAPLQETVQTTAIDEPKNRDLQPGTIFRITEDDISPISPLPDGGYLVEEDTGTVAYFGDAAKKFLENTTRFDNETEVILPADSSLEVTVGGETLSLFEPGAVLLGSGAEAKFSKVQGDILITSTKKAPDWYRKMAPNGELQGEFDKIAHLNQKLFSCVTNKGRFNQEDLKKLLNFGIVSPEPGDDNSVRWDTSIKNEEMLQSRLIEAGISGKAIDENSRIWYNTIKRKLYSYESGRVARDNFSPEQLGKMINAGIVKENFLDKNRVYWTSYSTEGELRQKLATADIQGEDAESILKSWRKTTKSGYDNTGLAWDKGKVVAYVLREKLNLWNERNTEWIVNSTEYCGENQPFTVGVSEVKAQQEYIQPSPFKDIRPGEVIHRHPRRDDKKQTESYLVTDGKAALLTIRNGEPHMTFMNPGDMAVITPGVAHCVLGMEGNYEHMCFQVPSAFQYGFLFKEELQYENFGANEKSLVEAALQGLKDGKHGTYNVRDLIKS